jgi:hypothetical protein
MNGFMNIVVTFPFGCMFDLNEWGLLHWTSCGEQWGVFTKVPRRIMK